VAFVSYRKQGDVYLLTHAEVPPAFEGKGIGSRLARGVLDLIRSRGHSMVPRCSFMSGYVERHPEYADLIARP
jgi:predicted GNAT family acetyltransferase